MDPESFYTRPSQDLVKVSEHRKKEDLDLLNFVSLFHTIHVSKTRSTLCFQ